MSVNSLILDLIFVAIIGISALVSAKRGFVKTLVETVGFVAAVFIAFTVSSPLADMVYDKMVEPPVIKAAVNSVDESAEHEAFNALPDFIVENSSEFFGATNKFTEKITENISKGTENAVRTASQEIVKPVVTKILSLLFSAILIIVLLILVKFLAKLLNGVFSFSVVGKINRALGGIIGVIKGIIFVLLIYIIVSFILSVTGKPFLIFTDENISSSYIFGFLSKTFPF